MNPGSVAMVAVLIGLQGPGVGAELEDAQLAKSVARLIAVPKAGKVIHIGTGFLFASGGSRRYVMTSAHLVKDATGVRVDFPGRQRFHAIKVWVDRTHDLAMIELNADAPGGAAPLRAYDGAEPSDEVKRGLRVAGYIQGYTTSTLRLAKLENRLTAREARADGKASEDCLGADVEVYQLHVDFSDGGSGSPVVDRAGRVLGVYQGGPMHGALSLNFCVPYVHLAGVVGLNPEDMTLVGRDIDQMSDLVVNGLFPSGPQELSGGLPSQFVINRMSHDAIFRDFFTNVHGRDRDEIRKGLDAILDHGKRQINHVINTRVGVGFLVPEGFELKEGFDDDTQAATLTIRRPGSDYTVRYYSRPLSLPKKDSPAERDGFSREAMKFLSRVLKVQITPPGTPPAQPGQAAIMPKPFSWPAAYRDSFANDLVAARAYYESGQALLHAYGFEMCRRASRFEVSGLSAPATAFTEKEPSEEIQELFFILSSSYDTQLGLERSRRLHEEHHKEHGHTLTRTLELPTPQPATASPPGMPAIKLYSPFPPAPDDKDAEVFSTAGGVASVEDGSRPEGDDNFRPVMFPAPAPGAAPARNPFRRGAPVPAPAPGAAPAPNPFRREYTASNLGITFHMIQLPNGRLGAQLNQLPAPGSPAARVLLGPNIPVFLTPGDIILALDGIPITEPNSFRMHFGPTWIDFIDGPTGQMMRGFTVLPGPMVP
jgi:S1-C subfamily serine protease